MASVASTRVYRWNRVQVLASSAVPAAANFAVPLALVVTLGLEYVGIWLAYRSFVLLISGALPLPSLALLVLLPKLRKHGKHAIALGCIASSSMTALGIAVLIGLISFALPLLASNEWFSVKDAAGLAVFATLTLYGSHFALVERGEMRSALLWRAGLWDPVATVLCTCAAFVDWTLFLWANAFRAAVRLTVLWSNTGQGSASAGSRHPLLMLSLLRRAVPHAVRGICQNVLQYGDRGVFLWIFGAGVAGAAGIGSTIATVATMLSSSAFAWFLPLTQPAGSAQRSNWLWDEWAAIGMLTVGLQFLVFFFIFLLNPRVDASISPVLVAAVGLSASLASSFMLLAHSAESVVSWRSLTAATGQGLFGIGVMAASFWLGCSSGIAIVLGQAAAQVWGLALYGLRLNVSAVAVTVIASAVLTTYVDDGADTPESAAVALVVGVVIVALYARRLLSK